MTMTNPPPQPNTRNKRLNETIQKAKHIPFFWIVTGGLLLGFGILFGSLFTGPSTTAAAANQPTSFTGPIPTIAPETQYGYVNDHRIATLGPSAAPVQQPLNDNAVPHIAPKVSEATIMGEHESPSWSTSSATPKPEVHVAVVYDATHQGQPILQANADTDTVPAISGSPPSDTSPSQDSPKRVSSEPIDGSSTMVMPDVESTPGPVTIPAGTQIRAILDDDIGSDLPGPVRAHILEDICDPRTGDVAIPRGSWLLGDEGTHASGDRHLFITWARLTYPDLSSRLLISVANLDQTGHAGIAGRPNISRWTTFRDSLTTSLASSAGMIANQAASRHIGNTSTINVDVPSAVGAPGSAAVPDKHQSWTISHGTMFQLYLERDFDRAQAYRHEVCGSAS